MCRWEEDGMDDLGIIGILILGVMIALGLFAVACYIWWIT